MIESLRILFIEDSVDDCDLIIRELKKSGHLFEFKRVESETLLNEALQSRWDLIISDFRLPALDAFTVLDICQERCPDIPIIIVSGTVGEELAVLALKAGAADYVLKGNMTRLVPAIEREIREAKNRAEKKNIQSILKKREEELRQIQKLESVGQLAGGIAHDFNNIMATILAQTDILLDKMDGSHGEIDPQYLQKGLLQIQKSAERASRLTRQLLAFSRKQPINPQIIDLNALIVDLEKMLHRLVEENISFSLSLAPDLKNTKIDASQAEQIILNLVINARDAMPKGGVVTLSTRTEKISEQVAKTFAVEPGFYNVIFVGDIGCGMDAQTREKIFEPFFTTKPVGKGTGLGLSTVYGIVRQNNGFIRVESIPDQGSQFEVFLPVTQAVVPQNKSSQKILVISQVQGKHLILVVEDEVDLRVIIHETLKEKGYEVHSLGNGKEALDWLKEQTVPPQLVVSDMIMPCMGGPELRKEALKLFPELPFLFLSGHSDQFHPDPSDKTMDFLEKPFNLGMFLNRVHTILSGTTADSGPLTLPKE